MFTIYLILRVQSVYLVLLGSREENYAIYPVPQLSKFWDYNVLKKTYAKKYRIVSELPVYERRDCSVQYQMVRAEVACRRILYTIPNTPVWRTTHSQHREYVTEDAVKHLTNTTKIRAPSRSINNAQTRTYLNQLLPFRDSACSPFPLLLVGLSPVPPPTVICLYVYLLNFT